MPNTLNGERPCSFEVKIIEELTDDVVDQEMVSAMRLPFDQGWSLYGVFQGDHNIAVFTDFELATDTCSALNNLVRLEAA